VTVTLVDRLDTNNATELLDELKRYAGQPIKQVIFDCARLGYISSAGLRVLIFAKQKIAPGGVVSVQSAPASVVKVIRMSGFDAFLTLSN